MINIHNFLLARLDRPAMKPDETSRPASKDSVHDYFLELDSTSHLSKRPCGQGGEGGRHNTVCMSKVYGKWHVMSVRI